MAITDSAGTVHIVRLDKTINLHKGVLVLGSMLLGFATFFTHYFVTLADVSIQHKLALASRHDDSAVEAAAVDDTIGAVGQGWPWGRRDWEHKEGSVVPPRRGPKGE